MSQSQPRSRFIDDEAICVDGEINSIAADPEVPTRRETSSPKEDNSTPSSPSPSAERQDSLLPTGQVIRDDAEVAADLFAELERRHRKGVAEREKNRSGPLPLPARGGIERRRHRHRTRARPPNADARRCPSPGHDNSPSFWRNGRNPPTNCAVYKCIDCKLWFTHAAFYHNHIASDEHEFKVGAGSRIYWCGICRRTLLTSNDHNIHLESKNHWRRYRELTRERTKLKIPSKVNELERAADSLPDDHEF